MAFPFSQLKNTSLLGESCAGANLMELWEEVSQIQCEFQVLFANLYSNFGKAGRAKTNPLAARLWAASMSPWTCVAVCVWRLVCVPARHQLPYERLFGTDSKNPSASHINFKPLPLKVGIWHVTFTKATRVLWDAKSRLCRAVMWFGTNFRGR